MTREWKLFIQDICDAIQHIKGFIGNMSFKEFLTDEKTRSAVVFKTITSVASLGSGFQLCK